MRAGIATTASKQAKKRKAWQILGGEAFQNSGIFDLYVLVIMLLQ